MIPRAQETRNVGDNSRHTGRGGLSTSGSALSLDDRVFLSHVDSELTKGLALARWWRRQGGLSGAEAQRFELVAQARGESAYGMRQIASIPGLGTFPVIAAVQKIPFDRPKPVPGEENAAAKWTAEQVREFALGYLLRSTSFAQAQSYPDLGQAPLPAYLRLVSWCPVEGVGVAGAEIRQLYFKRRDGRLGRFAERERRAIVDLREIGPVYDWVVLSARLFDTSVNLSLAGPDSPTLVLPLDRRVYMALTPELIYDDGPGNSPEGFLGRFGPGFVYLGKNPNTVSSFTPAFQTMVLQTAESGETEIQIVWVGRREGFPLRVFVDPGNMLNWLRGATLPGQISRRLLYQHVLEQRRLAFIAMNVWNAVPDWLDKSRIPAWLAGDTVAGDAMAGGGAVGATRP